MSQRWALASLHLTVLLFGGAGLFGRWLSVSPWMMVFGRTLFAALALALCLRWLRRPASPRLDWRWAAQAGGCLALH